MPSQNGSMVFRRWSGENDVFTYSVAPRAVFGLYDSGGSCTLSGVLDMNLFEIRDKQIQVGFDRGG